ncbi:MAG: tyrosine-type recombinase/integrase [Planctomycetes bacterium]|nr:tyrosine-type recombinase/integrase [Planctomycetota bacterium]
MPRPRNHVPSYRLHKQSGQAIVTISTNGTRRDVLLGKYGSPESQAEYRRLLAELEVAGAATVAARAGGSDRTVGEVMVAFLEWAQTYYKTHDGTQTSELSSIKRALKPLKDLYASTLATEFGPRALAVVRDQMVKAKLCRTLINKRVDRVKRMFKWATAEELVPVAVYQSLRTLAGLKRGRTEAHEPEPIKPVDPTHVAATLPHLNRHVRAMVELQTLSGMRPGEVCKMTLAEVDRSREVWVYRPGKHKTAHHGKTRAIHLGPKARAVLLAFLTDDHAPPEGWNGVNLVEDHTGRLAMADAYEEAGRERDAVLLRDITREVVLIAGCVVDPHAALFSSREGQEDRYRMMRAKRKSKVPPSQKSRKKKNPERSCGDRYTPESYAHAVGYATKTAGVPHWHPNQLRHTFATEVRKVHGLEAAQVLLGHSRADVTQVYAERDESLAVKVAGEIG